MVSLAQDRPSPERSTINTQVHQDWIPPFCCRARDISHEVAVISSGDADVLQQPDAGERTPNMISGLCCSPKAKLKYLEDRTDGRDFGERGHIHDK